VNRAFAELTWLIDLVRHAALVCQTLPRLAKQASRCVAVDRGSLCLAFWALATGTLVRSALAA
jgi:hypothetical protein